ncbi:hypothetical protein ACFXGT_27020 [Streptomyces sp. NPDC059352]|uniref:hypothetical protein n=1 Tax=Streptomyces sp. NPDC059352 TaxID=3346810 RepID=UPI0036C951D2
MSNPEIAAKVEDPLAALASFGFAIPHEGRQLRYKQELHADTRGIFTGRIKVPATAR